MMITLMNHFDNDHFDEYFDDVVSGQK